MDEVVIVVYDREHKFNTPQEAEDFLLECMSFCDPRSSEHGTYAEALGNLREKGKYSWV